MNFLNKIFRSDQDPTKGVFVLVVCLALLVYCLIYGETP